MEPLGALSGAAGGMADAVAGIIEQRLRQTQVANQLAETQARNSQAQAALAETQRAHEADEGTRQQLANQMKVYQDSEAANAAAERKQAMANATQGVLKTLPTGTNVTPDRYGTLLTQGALPEQFTGYQPPTMGMSTPTAEVGPSAGGYKTVGIQSELDKANKLPPSETMNARKIEVADIMAKPQATWTPDETAKVTGMRGLLKLEGEQAANRMQVSVNATDTRQSNSLSDKAIETELTDVKKRSAGLKFANAADLMDSLRDPGGVSDVTAVPQFLKLMAGGQGSGFRMTQSELNMLSQARPVVESWGMKLNNIADNYQNLTDDQKAQMTRLAQKVAQRESQRAQLYDDAQQKIIGAKTPAEAHQYRLDLDKAEHTLYRGMIGLTPTEGTTPVVDPAAAGGGGGSTSTRRHYDVNLNPIPPPK